MLLPRKANEDDKDVDENNMQEVDVMHMTRTQVCNMGCFTLGMYPDECPLRVPGNVQPS